MSLCPAFSDPSWLHVSECNKGKMMGYWGRDKRGGDILIGGGGEGWRLRRRTIGLSWEGRARIKARAKKL